jgi:hypothetical protein
VLVKCSDVVREHLGITAQAVLDVAITLNCYGLMVVMLGALTSRCRRGQVAAMLCALCPLNFLRFPSPFFPSLADAHVLHAHTISDHR